MAHGEREAMLKSTCGKDYYKKKGFTKRIGCMPSVSHRPGVNKLTKRFTNKTERSQVKEYLYNYIYNE